MIDDATWERAKSTLAHATDRDTLVFAACDDDGRLRSHMNHGLSDVTARHLVLIAQRLLATALDILNGLEPADGVTESRPRVERRHSPLLDMDANMEIKP